MRAAGWALLAAALALGACSSSGASSAGTPDGTVSVVATTTQLADFARQVGGDRVHVYGVLKPNVDPHDYEPSPADLDALAKADVIVENGVGLEKWFEDTISSASPRGVIVDASAGIALRHRDGAEGPADPHIWHDPRNAVLMATSIERALEQADPADAATFKANLATYTAALDQLDADIAGQIATLTNKRIVTNHDAFGYYADRYGLDVIGSIVPSFDTSAQLSAQEIADIVAAIKASGVKAVFSETSVPAKAADAIGSEAGVRVVAGDDALYGDTLGPDGSDADTYLKMEAHNTKVIVANLG